MPRNINQRLSNLSERRKGVDPRSRSRIGVALAQDMMAKSLLQEAWQRRATSQPFTRYALGAMEAVGRDYTQKSVDEAERVAKQLRDGLTIPLTTRLQGSVPLDVHIRGVSDVDLLVLRTDFYTYAVSGARSRGGLYTSPSTRTSIGVLLELRRDAEALLQRRFWGATVDCSGGKAIALSGGSLERPVDVVPSHWDDNATYQSSLAEHDRGVTIVDKNTPKTIDNLPFTHIKRIHDRDGTWLGSLKKAIRLVKNVRNDAEYESLAAQLPSFDIAALMYHADTTALTAGYLNELYILAEAQRFLDWCYRNKDQATQLRTPDGLRRILDSEAKFDGLRTISCELDDLAQAVAREQGLSPAAASWMDIRRALGAARIPAAA